MMFAGVIVAAGRLSRGRLHSEKLLMEAQHKHSAAPHPAGCSGLPDLMAGLLAVRFHFSTSVGLPATTPRKIRETQSYAVQAFWPE